MSDDHARWRPPDRTDHRSPFVSESEDRTERTWSRPGATTVDVGRPIIEAEGLRREYRVGPEPVVAVDDVDLEVERGQLVAIQGRSGSGKTTLLNLIGGLDGPTAGRVWVGGDEVTAMTEEHLVILRRETIGFIFQAFGLLPILTATENIELPLRMTGTNPGTRDERVRVLLELVGLGERGQHRPHELSGGEQQRVAIARALANGPQLLLADEPTGQLDLRTGRTIMELIQALVHSEGLTALVATHDPALLDMADRVLELRDGQILADTLEAAD